MHPQFLSNTFLVGDGAGGPAFFIDAGGPVAPLIKAAERLALTPTHVLLTHHHYDHICDVGELRERWPKLEVLISPIESELIAAAAAESGADAPAGSEQLGSVQAGQTLRFGTLEVCPLHTPGHTAGMLSFLVGDRSSAGSTDRAPSTRRSGSSATPGGFNGAEAAVFTGDTLFKNSVGGVKAPGHSDATTVGEEWEGNGFIRVWRGLDPEGAEPCTALGEPATLVLLGQDYDGGTKAWVRWPDGADDIVPGSRVERSG